MATRSIPDHGLTLQSELKLHQELALNRLTPGVVIALLLFSAAGFGKYWNSIPVLDGVLWASALLVLLGLAGARWWIKRQGQATAVEGERLHVLAPVWALALGSLFAMAAHFGLHADGIDGRVTFAIMLVGLGGSALSTTYMVPKVAASFFVPMFVAIGITAPQIDPHVSLLQKVGMMAAFMALFTVIILVNWRMFRAGVEAMVERDRHRLEIAERRAEMNAARHIQLRLLPKPDGEFSGDRRFALAASLESAGEMTGDLYDFFMIDADRVFFMVGDVCGKGVTSSLLMAVTKVTVKSAVLRREAPLGEIMTEANRELAREDHDDQFVTCFAGILDARKAIVEYCNAGHEPPLLMSAESGKVTATELVGGPPLCAVTEFDYATGRLQLQPGETLILVTDGVTEAHDPQRRPFGGAGITEVLEGLPAGQDVDLILAALRSAVSRYTGAGAQHDDQTMLALRWKGKADEQRNLPDI